MSSNGTYTCEAEIGERLVRISYRAPEDGVEPLRVWRIRYDGRICPMRWTKWGERARYLVYEACELDYTDRVQAQIDEQADAKLEDRRDAELG